MTSRSFFSLALLVTVPSALVACGGDDNEAYLAAHGERDASVATVADAGNDAGTSGDASLPTFAIGGTVSGLAIGSTLALSDGAGDTLTVVADGTFLFRAVPTGTAYAISVVTQPSSPPETCTVAHGTGILGSVAVSNVEITCAVPAFTVGGTIAGLAGTGLVLEDNLGDDLPVAAASGADAGSVAFTFATPVATGGAYSVTVKTQPSAPAQLCAVTRGAGTIASADVSDVAITCESSYPVSATVSGLGTGETLVLQDNGGDDLTITADGTQTFATLVNSGSAYAATVLTQPSTPPEQCTVAGGSGNATANVSIAVSCTPAYYVDVTKGADTNAGTPAAPWKTITHAIATVPAAGGTIYVAPGTYDETSGEVFPLEPGSNQVFVGDVDDQGADVVVTSDGGSAHFLVGVSNVAGVSLSGFALLSTGTEGAVYVDDATASFTSNTLTSVEFEFYIEGTANVTLTNNALSDGEQNIYLALDAGGSLKARDNTLTLASGTVAVVSGNGTVAGSSIDFGTEADPGNNTLVSDPSGDGFELEAPIQGVLASGNTWAANVQGADASGHYTAHLVPGPVEKDLTANFTIFSSAGSIQF